MPEFPEGRVAVYIDFDNIVISRFSQTHGGGRRKTELLRDITSEAIRDDTAMAVRLAAARVDLGAILDYASSFGTVAIARAYADWAVPVNASYQDQLVGRAVDLVQMFPTVQSMKNGADIRMSVDVIEDLFRFRFRRVVIVSGDSDLVAGSPSAPTTRPLRYGNRGCRRDEQGSQRRVQRIQRLRRSSWA